MTTEDPKPPLSVSVPADAAAVYVPGVGVKQPKAGPFDAPDSPDLRALVDVGALTHHRPGRPSGKKEE